MTTTSHGSDDWRKWLVLGAFSLLLFLITAATYSSLGVVLPQMVMDLNLDWTSGGLGFTLLGVFTGASSLLPAIVIRHAGARATIVLGSLIMGGGLALFSVATGVITYFAAAALCGVGYQMTALVPGTHVLGSLFTNKTRVFGFYFTFGSLGGVAGPWMVEVLTGASHDWRFYWMVQAVLAVVLGVACALAVGSRAWLKASAVSESEDVEEAKAANPAVYRTSEDWTVKEALRTPQFFVLVAAYFMHLLSGATVAAVSVAHLQQIGVAGVVASAMLSIESLFAAGSRFGGGLIGDRLDPRHMLILSQVVTAFGLVMLGSGLTSYPAMLAYALGTGCGFGLTALAVTVLLVNYYGRKNYLELFSITCLAGAISASGPFIGGFMRDHLGSFAPTFQLFAVIAAAVTVAALLMRPPMRHGAAFVHTSKRESNVPAG